jgi:hypothetical protein
VMDPQRTSVTAPQLNAFAFQFLHGGLMVVTHQVEFLTRFLISLSRMGSKFRGRCGKNQSAMACVERPESQHVAQKCADFVCVRGIEMAWSPVIILRSSSGAKVSIVGTTSALILEPSCRGSSFYASSGN